MAWIESHQNIEKHPKTKRLSRLMNWDLDVTIGKLHRFWWWCVDYAEDGDLRKYNDSDLAEAVGLDASKGKEFVDSMVNCGGETASGFIDRKPYFRVHDWWDYIGLFLQRKYGEKKKESWVKIKQLYNSCTNTVQQLSQPNQTKPNQTKPKEKNRPPPFDSEFFSQTKPSKPKEENRLFPSNFESLWEKYPQKEGKKEAFRHMKASIKTQQDYSDCCKAIENYLQCEKVEKGYVKKGSTFFNNWQDWINPTLEMIGHKKQDNEQSVKKIIPRKVYECEYCGGIGYILMRDVSHPSYTYTFACFCPNGKTIKDATVWNGKLKQKSKGTWFELVK